MLLKNANSSDKRDCDIYQPGIRSTIPAKGRYADSQGYRLKNSSLPMSAPACFEELKSCHLNRAQSAPDTPVSYVLTDHTPEQYAILKCLCKLHLIDETEISSQITLRGGI